MAAFLRRALCFVALQLAVWAGLESFYQRRYLRPGYLAAWSDKRARLEACAPPRVLLVGGSNLAFGVDSTLLERLLGRPVVNLALHGGLGREVALRQAEHVAAPGDLVVVGLEYATLATPAVLDPPLMLDLLATQPRAARYVEASDGLRLLDLGLAALGKRARAWGRYLWRAGWREAPPEGPYLRAAFDEHGDVIGHLALARRRPFPPGYPQPGAAPERFELAVARLNLLAARLAARQTQAVLLVPVVPDSAYAAHAPAFERYWAALAQRLRLPIVGRRLPALPERLFFDTYYHLGRRGRRERTRALGDELAAWLPRTAPLSAAY